MGSRLASLVRELWGIPLDEIRVLRRQDHISYAEIDRKVLVGHAGDRRYVVKMAMVEAVDLDRFYGVARESGLPTIHPIPTRQGRLAVRLKDRFLLVFPFEDLGPCRDAAAMTEALLAFHRLELDGVLLRATDAAADVAEKLARFPGKHELLRRFFHDLDALLPQLGGLLSGGQAPAVIHGSPWVGNFFDGPDGTVLIDFDSVRAGDARLDLVRLVESYPLLAGDPVEAGRLGRQTIDRLCAALPERFRREDLRAFFLASSVLALDTEVGFHQRYLASLQASGLVPPA